MAKPVDYINMKGRSNLSFAYQNTRKKCCLGWKLCQPDPFLNCILIKKELNLLSSVEHFSDVADRSLHSAEIVDAIIRRNKSV